MNSTPFILAIGAHPDDIEIGCGGALAQHVQVGHRVRLIVMSGGEQGGASRDMRVQELINSAQTLGVQDVIVLPYEDTKVPFSSESIRAIEQAIAGEKIDRVYLPYPHEIHQDHMNTARAGLAACRNVPQILQYEGPSTSPDFQAHFYVHIENVIDQKLAALACYTSQGQKEILKQASIRGLNQFRGYQARTTFAEGFSVYRFIECL